MLGIQHPLDGGLYERDGKGNVLVTRDGRTGLFTEHGRWIEGELRECDPHMCGWVAGPQVANHRMSEAATDR